MYWTWRAGVVGAVGRGEEVVGGRIVDGVAAAPTGRRPCRAASVDERAADPAEAGGVVGAAGEDHLDVGAVLGRRRAQAADGGRGHHGCDEKGGGRQSAAAVAASNVQAAH